MSYEVPEVAYEKLKDKVASWMIRQDLSHLTLDDLDAGEEQGQIDKMSREEVQTLGNPSDVLDQLFGEHLQVKRKLQVAAHFYDETGTKIDPFKRRRSSFRLQKEGLDSQRKNARDRAGADNIADTLADVHKSTQEMNLGLLTQLINTGSKTDDKIHDLLVKSRTDDLNHHKEILTLHVEKLRLDNELQFEKYKAENAGLLDDFRKLPAPTQAILLNKLFEFLDGVKQSWDKSNALKAESVKVDLEIKKLELENKRALLRTPNDSLVASSESPSPVVESLSAAESPSESEVAKEK